MTDIDRDTLMESAIVVQRTRFMRSPQIDVLYKAAAKNVYDIFSSQTDPQSIMEIELAYMKAESEYTHADLKKMFADTIAAYRNALNLLKIVMEEPEMYLKYCVPACEIMKRKSKRGLPHDAFHFALALHNMRLQRELGFGSHMLLDEDYELLKLRLANLMKAWELYMGLQRKVLTGDTVVSKLNESVQKVNNEQVQVNTALEAKERKAKHSHEERIELLHRIFDLYGNDQVDEGIALFKQHFPAEKWMERALGRKYLEENGYDTSELDD